MVLDPPKYIYLRWLLILIYHIWNRNGKETSFWCNVNQACSHACGPKVSQWDTYRYNAYIWIPHEISFIQCNKWSQNTILTFLGCLDYLGFRVLGFLRTGVHLWSTSTPTWSSLASHGFWTTQCPIAFARAPLNTSMSHMCTPFDCTWSLGVAALNPHPYAS